MRLSKFSVTDKTHGVWKIPAFYLWFRSFWSKSVPSTNFYHVCNLYVQTYFDASAICFLLNVVLKQLISGEVKLNHLCLCFKKMVFLLLAMKIMLTLCVPAQRVAVFSSFLLSRRSQGTRLQTQWASNSLHITVSLLCCNICSFFFYKMHIL